MPGYMAWFTIQGPLKSGPHEVYTHRDLPQETRKTSNRLTLYQKELEKEQHEGQS